MSDEINSFEYTEEFSSGKREYTGEMYAGEFTSGEFSKGYFSAVEFDTLTHSLSINVTLHAQRVYD